MSHNMLYFIIYFQENLQFSRKKYIRCEVLSTWRKLFQELMAYSPERIKEKNDNILFMRTQLNFFYFLPLAAIYFYLGCLRT